MALLENWKDKVDGQDDILAEDINSLAHGIQDAGAQIDGISTPYIGDNGNWFIYDVETKAYVDSGNPARGEKGDAGATGETGAGGYTPVKGTDYWTDADKAEIVNDVLAALPDGDEVSY